MKETIIRNRQLQIVGYIKTESNGDKKVYNFSRMCLGKYDAATDTTRDFYGRIVAYGEACAVFLKDLLD